MTRALMTFLIATALSAGGAWAASESLCVSKQGLRCALRTFWGRLLSASAEEPGAVDRDSLFGEARTLAVTGTSNRRIVLERASRVALDPVIVRIDSTRRQLFVAPCRLIVTSSQSGNALQRPV